MPRVVLQEGLWLLQRFVISGIFFSTVTILRWTKKEVSAGCSGLLRSSLQPTAHRDSGSMTVGALCFWSSAQGQDVSQV